MDQLLNENKVDSDIEDKINGVREENLRLNELIVELKQSKSELQGRLSKISIASEINESLKEENRRLKHFLKLKEKAPGLPKEDRVNLILEYKRLKARLDDEKDLYKKSKIFQELMKTSKKIKSIRKL